MNGVWTWLILGATVAALAQQPSPTATPGSKVMLVAVSRDETMLTGGISSGKMLAPGKLGVEPLAWLTSAGEWKGFQCDEDNQEGCRRFEKEYLSKPHTYTVISADGRGATVKAAPTTLDECFGYTGNGTYSDASIGGTAIAADSTNIFTTGPSARRLTGKEIEPIRMALSKLVPTKLDSIEELRIYSLDLEGQDFFVVQRAFQDYASKPGHQEDRLKLIFAIGTMEQGRFHLLQWKRNIEDENELVLGTIHLNNGRDFLITTVSDPESQSFRVYGIKDGQLKMVYAGGGSSC
jgi:hypothetical protein